MIAQKEKLNPRINGHPVINYLRKKDISKLVFQLSCVLLLLLLVASVLYMEIAVDKLLAVSVLATGIALGWVLGILISPLANFNNEINQFTKVQQLVSTFLTGAISVKALQWLNTGGLANLLSNDKQLTRFLYFLAVTVFSAIIVYYERVYLDGQDNARISVRNNSIRPGEAFSLAVDRISDLMTITLENKGETKLRLLRSDDYHPEILDEEPSKGVLSDAGNRIVKYTIKDIALEGKYIFIINLDSGKDGSFKLRIY